MKTAPDATVRIHQAQQALAKARSEAAFTAANQKDLGEAEKLLQRVLQRLANSQEPQAIPPRHPTQIQLMQTERALKLRERQMELQQMATRLAAPQHIISQMEAAVRSLTDEIAKITHQSAIRAIAVPKPKIRKDTP